MPMGMCGLDTYLKSKQIRGAMQKNFLAFISIPFNVFCAESIA